MKSFLAYVSAKPVTGLSMTATAVILKWMGMLTPYLAFLGICLGVSASIYSLSVKRIEKKKLQLEMKNLSDKS